MRTMTANGAVVAIALALAGCGVLGGGDDAESGEVRVGSANFPESQLLGEIYAQALEDKGITVSRNLNTGEREVTTPALDGSDGEASLDLMPEYTGNLMLYYDPDSDVTDPEGIYQHLTEVVPDTVDVLEKSDAVDQDVLVVTQETAEKYDLQSIPDLEGVSEDLVVGGGPEFKTRQAGLKGLQEDYGLEFKEFRTLDAGGPQSLNALLDNDIQVTQFFSTQAIIPDNNLVTLEDPKNISIAQNIVPIIRSDVNTEEITEALNAVSAKLTTDNVTQMVKEVSETSDYAGVAQTFLEDNGLVGTT
ncbi:MAG: ABC transporter, substrate-binding protein (cluster 13, osmolytes) [uncultured Nocardioidaceae bacterium]|uniref:ABC transporter, substrate-binding protein (Cluster 13, osmolytes) n=1 Tax=uncultured Nocardioidaceae bacterium TaxID=253824 RepID=A0A6J4NCM9_9ACTN|nr:MAG: ABC transporter, substrate-binding protein (cluster 13, osmolytes) [uncultured Nocardioidaceae bacterium]